VQTVAEFFRYNVKKGKDIVALREEIELVDNYIYILNVRFSGDIHYDKDIDPALLGVQVPSMILQPIVENSVNHGIREMAGEGRIWLSVYAQEDTTCISIRDNGAGMSAETIERIISGSYSAASADTNGIGMDNVIARLRLFTGNDEVMSIISPGENKGTEVVIYIQNRDWEESDVQDYVG
jgi:sensor histidine kinase YesM